VPGEGGRIGSVDNGKGIVSSEMDGCDVGGVERNSPLVNVIPPCMNMDESVIWEESHTIELLPPVCE
jgi:hypothetical protein